MTRRNVVEHLLAFTEALEPFWHAGCQESLLLPGEGVGAGKE
ncbi:MULTISPECIES: hypothetical protein [unclassified Pseudomonas]|jgi:hypothetical protein|nr:MULTISPECIES: hypothetical protein [unclassified Pseudomonas]WPN44529.1 hypothetical protein QMK58_15095 [Pseudomonas sp. P8_241]